MACLRVLGNPRSLALGTLAMLVKCRLLNYFSFNNQARPAQTRFDPSKFRVLG